MIVIIAIIIVLILVGYAAIVGYVLGKNSNSITNQQVSDILNRYKVRLYNGEEVIDSIKFPTLANDIRKQFNKDHK